MTPTERDITRTVQMEERYKKHKETLDMDNFVFDLENEEIVREFTYWVIIHNAFPYDGVLQQHHMLVPRRFFSTPKEINSKEREELEDIKEILIGEYDGVFENLAHKRSVPVHFHIHLFLWRHIQEDQ